MNYVEMVLALPGLTIEQKRDITNLMASGANREALLAIARTMSNCTCKVEAMKEDVSGFICPQLIVNNFKERWWAQDDRMHCCATGLLAQYWLDMASEHYVRLVEDNLTCQQDGTYIGNVHIRLRGLED